MDTRHTQQYLYADNRLAYNPEYHPANSEEPYYVPPSNQALVYLSSPQDIQAAKAIMGNDMVLASNVINAMDQLKSPEYAEKLHAKKIHAKDHDAIMKQLLGNFAKYGIPIGMLSKLLEPPHKRHFIVDDSGSMTAHTDLTFATATPYLQHRGKPGEKLTRWQEAEDRLHKLVEILAYLPNEVTITFMNRDNEINFKHKKDVDPIKYLEKAHKKITEAFKKIPSKHDLTPTYAALKKAFDHKSPCKVYLLTDGKPNQKGVSDEQAIENVKDLIRHRGHDDPSKFPFTILPCSDNDIDLQWTVDIDNEDERGYIAQVDDLKTETAQVNQKQGFGIYYDEGLWLLCNLEAANNPHDLDKLDEDKPFTKKTFNEFFGRIMMLQEYYYYFSNHPVGKVSMDLYQYYISENSVAAQIDHVAIRKTIPPQGWTSMQAGQMYAPTVQNPPPAQQPAQLTPTPSPFKY